MHLVSHRRYRWVRVKAEKERVQGRLPPFSRSLGLDVIITAAGRPVLVELQHGFGRRGLLMLFPEANRSYRKTYWRLRRECGRSLFVAEEMQRICGDKILTYRHFARHQPRSLVYQRWSAKVEAWLDALDCQHVLAKPPRGSCGKGIVVLQRERLRASAGELDLGSPPLLLQELIPSRPLLDGDGRPHLGCIRHIVVLHSDGHRLGLIHLPPYWRVSPVALTPGGEEREALTANISRGAYPVQADASDAAIVRALAEQVVGELVQLVLGLDELPQAPSEVIEPTGHGPCPGT